MVVYLVSNQLVGVRFALPAQVNKIKFMDHPFLNESWNRLATDRTNPHTDDVCEEEPVMPEIEIEKLEKNEQVRIYKVIEQQSGYDENTQTLFADLKEGIRRYYKTIAILENAKLEQDTKKIEDAELARTRAHDMVISNLNALSRYVGKHNLDNDWRSMVGLGRKQVTRWVMNILPYIILTSER